MNKNNGIIIGIVALAAIIIVAIVVLAMRAPKAATPVPVAAVVTTKETPKDTTSAPSRTPGSPAAVTSSSASPTDTTSIVRGTVTPNGALTNYWYEYGTSTNLGTSTSKQSVGSGYAVTSAPGYVTGLTKDTAYYFRLIAENQFGRVLGTVNSFSTTHGNPPPVGGAPTAKTLAASNITRTDVVLNGQVVPNRSQTTYWYEYGTSTSLGFTTEFVSIGNGSAQVNTSVSLVKLQPLTTYSFRLYAQNQFGTVQGTTMSFKTAGPAAPSVPVASTGNSSSVRATVATVHGTVTPNGDETTYWFEYGADTLTGNVLPSASDRKSAGNGTRSIAVQADLTRLTSKTKYYYQLVAQNSTGTVRGDRVSFTTR